MSEVRKIGKRWWVTAYDEPVGPYASRVEAVESLKRMDIAAIELMTSKPDKLGRRTRETERRAGWIK